MFKIGDVISVSRKGICKVEDIAKNVYDGCDKNKEYYVLRPVDEINNMVIYLPIDTKLDIRKILQKTEAKKQLECLAINSKNDLQLESFDEIPNIISGGEFMKWVSLLKFLAKRKQSTVKKMFTAQEQKQFEQVFLLVCNEFAYALGRDKLDITNEVLDKLNLKD